ncbi:MAG: succinyl-diaminopimelate desuccinylase [Pseudomonadales bacterium]
MDALTEEIVDLTCRLIERSSVTPEDAGCQDLIIRHLEDQGFTVTRLPSADVRNFWASRGDGAPTVVFAGHTDVVPAGPREAWRFDPFSPTLVDGELYGRGSADMKGSLAAMLAASRRFVAGKPDHAGSIAYLITSDEEGVATDGTVKVVDWLVRQGIAPEYCIVGEPSSSRRVGDVVRIGRRGSLNGTLVVKGVQGHVAYPEQADNPIHRALAALDELAGTSWDDGNDAFPPTSFQISNINGGTGATNVIPGELTVLFNLRFSTEQTSDGLKRRIEALLDRHGLHYDLAWHTSGEPFKTASPHLIDVVRGSVASVQGFDPTTSTGGGTSDGRFIARLGTEIVELGPVNATIHSVDEHTNATDLARLSDMYLEILDRLLGDGR